MARTSEMADVLSEYRSVYTALGMTAEEFEQLLDYVPGDPDQLADAVKEFQVRAWERGIKNDRKSMCREFGRTAALLSVGDTNNQHYTAATLFGVRAEDLGVGACMTLAALIAEGA